MELETLFAVEIYQFGVEGFSSYFAKWHKGVIRLCAMEHVGLFAISY